ncbi:MULTISPECIES: Chromate resistance protein ChrB [unclassified Streptomyces]|uniref:Chromate resistance protein ChrB n=1 Tax=unclassified Streptomyces TaxID=2593676 RepID=UPI002DD971A1|nr:Chromate resistance protein ChrB [Streptomyces sp. NBC_01750]WSB01367.1 hypothetical protein OIE54_19860 [Streptomyces sp. NBC_01794]WSD34286.1 hypothetical protein OG966_21810 [Streptomyces sp. NBC_01750]
MIKLPAEPSRVAVWRQLRKIGGLSLGQGIGAVPDVPVFADGVRRKLTERAVRGGDRQGDPDRRGHPGRLS